MKWCKNCVLPDTRPSVSIDENGICRACKTHGEIKDVNWDERKQQFLEQVQFAKENSDGYDCLIPVSGGKDSHWQVITCLNHGLNPLTVTWKPPVQTELGRKNLENLINLGVDHLRYTINPEVEKKFLYQSLVESGSTGIPKHMALYHIPPKLAIKFNIPLIVWGENSAMVYGDLESDDRGDRMGSRRYSKKGVTDGKTAEDWISDKLTREELTPYFGPTGEEIENHGIRSIYLGYYFNWDPQKSFEVAREHGFKPKRNPQNPNFYQFSDVESDFVSIHHYLKWYKFGITRLFHNLSLEIRNERMTREEAIEIIRDRAPGTPLREINLFCDYVGITKEEFFHKIEKFRNREIWSIRDGRWVMDDFLIKDWDYWDTSKFNHVRNPDLQET